MAKHGLVMIANVASLKSPVARLKLTAMIACAISILKSSLINSQLGEVEKLALALLSLKNLPPGDSKHGR